MSYKTINKQKAQGPKPSQPLQRAVQTARFWAKKLDWLGTKLAPQISHDEGLSLTILSTF